MMITMIHHSSILCVVHFYCLLFLHRCSATTNVAFVPVKHPTTRTAPLVMPFRSTSPTTVADATGSVEESNPMRLTPELLKISNAFESIGDDKLRYKQLLYMANQLEPLDSSKQIPENKVQGCLSTVYIDVKPSAQQTGDGALRIDFVGDSDGLLTKGLVSLLIRGLSGNTAADIALVDPAFIQKAGIAASLTPGRNNGFLNMLATMKRKAQVLQASYEAAGESQSPSTDDTETDGSGPLYGAMVKALQQLKPVKLDLVDVSYQHAGHMEAGSGGETHFDLYIVADAFEGLNLVKRHRAVYMILGDIMPKIHALQIQAKTPAEVSE